MPTDATPQATQGATHGYESKDLKIKWPIIILVAMMVAAVVIHVLIWYWLKYYTPQPFLGEGRPAARQVFAGPELWETYPLPRLQSSPPLDMAAWRAHEDAELTNYGWVDQKAGVVRIPIDRAMELVVERGFPARTNGVSTPPKNGKTPLQLLYERRDRQAEQPEGQR